MNESRRWKYGYRCGYDAGYASHQLGGNHDALDEEEAHGIQDDFYVGFQLGYFHGEDDAMAENEYDEGVTDDEDIEEDL